MNIGQKIYYFKETNSTMEDCARLAKLGAPNGTMVLANYQESGRGRFKRKWLSPSGENIQMSILIKPNKRVLHLLNMFTSLAVLSTCEEILETDGSIKWPNDIHINGKKIAGILIETVIEGEEILYSNIGIGLNVNLNVESQPDIKDTATSLKSEKDRYICRSLVLKKLITELNFYYSQLGNSASLIQQWSKRLSTIGQTVTVTMGQNPNQTVLVGLAESITDDGGLVIRGDDGTKFTANAGEVTLAGG